MSYRYGVQHQQQDLFGADIQVILWDRFEENDLIKLEAQIDREAYYDVMWEAYKNIGRGSLSVRMMLGIEILKHMWKWISDEKLIDQLSSNAAVMRFCGYKNMLVAQQHIPKDSSSMTHFRNRISWCDGLQEMIQEVHLKSIMHKVPKKRRLQYDQDSTIIEESVSYPNDVSLLEKFSELASGILKKGRKKFGKVLEGIVAKGWRQAKKIALTYHFWSKKEKELRQDVQKKLLKIWDNMMWMLKEIQWKLWNLQIEWEKTKERFMWKLEKLIETWTTFLSQQKELVKEWVKSVPNRIVSFHKTYIRPIIKWKPWKAVQFWAKVQVWVIGRTLSMIVWHSRENEYDGSTVEQWVEWFKRACGGKPKEAWFDKWYRDQDAYAYLEKEWIVNGIQWSAKRKEHDKETRKRLYKRRAFTEPMINDLKTHRNCNDYKWSKQNAVLSLIFGTMAWNYVRTCI